MTRERWQQIKEKVQNSFSDFTKHTEALSDGSGGEQEILEFSTPQGKFKLVFTDKPRLLGEKTSYSKRIGSSVQVDRQYDTEERVTFLKAFQLEAGEWHEINASSFNI